MHVKSFDNDEDLFNYLDDISKKGIAQYKDMPQFLLDGMQVGHFYMTSEQSLVIFGEIIDSEYEEDRALMAANQHVRLVRAYSVVCPEGEMGNVRVMSLAPISKDDFQNAKDCDWLVPLPIALFWARTRISNLRAIRRD